MEPFNNEFDGIRVEGDKTKRQKKRQQKERVSSSSVFLDL